MKRLHGFTLIELLVVVAIIGVLAAIVLAALGTARSQASITADRASFHEIVPEAALYASNNNNAYGAFDDGSGGAAPCPTDGSSGSLFDDAMIVNLVQTAESKTGVNALCFANQQNYAIALPRPIPTDAPAPSSKYWCIDSTPTECGNNGDTSGNQPIQNGACIPCTTRQ